MLAPMRNAALNPLTLFPDLPDVVIEQVQVANEITVTLRAASPTASCPWGGTISKRVQSRYTRTLHDLPCSGCPVHLRLHVRHFFCEKSTGARKIFAEPFPELSRPHIQRTRQLQEALCRLGLTVGGQVGAQVGGQCCLLHRLSRLVHSTLAGERGMEGK